MIDDEIEPLVGLHLPEGVLGQDANGDMCILLYRAEVAALLCSSERFRECNELLGRAALRAAAADRPTRRVVEVDESFNGQTEVLLRFTRRQR